MDPLSQAQFGMVRRGSEAAVHQTRPLLGTLKKVADAAGYKLGRETNTTVTRDDQGNVVGSQTQVRQGFKTATANYNAQGDRTRFSMNRTGIPGLFGNRRSATQTTVQARNGTTRTGQQPPGTQPLGPNAPTQPGAPTSPTNPTVPLRQPMPFTPNPRGLRPNGMMNARFWPGETPQAPSPFQQTPRPVNLDGPTAPLPFNGSPQGRSDYGNPFGTP